MNRTGVFILMLIGAFAGSWGQQSWTAQSSGTTKNLNCICWGGGMYVAVGDTGTILTSPDGISWTLRNSEVSNDNLRGVAYGNGIFIATGQKGLVYRSSDLNSWAGSSVTSGANAIAYGNGNFALAFAKGDEVDTCSDGSSWKPAHISLSLSFTLQEINIRSLSYNGKSFIAVGRDTGQYCPMRVCYAVASGFATPVNAGWTSFTNTRELLGVAHGLHHSIAVGCSTAVLITDTGGHCSTVSSPGGNAVVYGNGKFVSAGPAGQLGVSSDDGITWTVSSTGYPDFDLYGIACGPGKFVAVGSHGTILTSSIPTSVAQPGRRFASCSSLRPGNGTVSYDLARNCRVGISLLDVRGKAVVGFDRVEAAGSHQINLGRHGLAPGIYFLHFRAGDQEQQAKVILSR